MLECWVYWLLRPAKDFARKHRHIGKSRGSTCTAEAAAVSSLRGEEAAALFGASCRCFWPFGVQESLRGSTEAAPFPGYASSGAPPPAMRSRRPTLAEARAQQEMRGIGGIIGRWCEVPSLWTSMELCENVWISKISSNMQTCQWCGGHPAAFARNCWVNWGAWMMGAWFVASVEGISTMLCLCIFWCPSSQNDYIILIIIRLEKSWTTRKTECSASINPWRHAWVT